MFNLVLALLAGVVTVAAPCTLPMLPILLGASVGQSGKARPAMIALGFIISFSATALLVSAITRVFDFDPNSLRTGAAILLVGFGLLMIWPAPFEWLSIRLGRITGGAAGSAATANGVLSRAASPEMPVVATAVRQSAITEAEVASVRSVMEVSLGVAVESEADLALRIE